MEVGASYGLYWWGFIRKEIPQGKLDILVESSKILVSIVGSFQDEMNSQTIIFCLMFDDELCFFSCSRVDKALADWGINIKEGNCILMSSHFHEDVVYIVEKLEDGGMFIFELDA